MVKKIFQLQSVKFLNGGIAMKAVAFGLNYLLADLLGYDPAITYVAVLLVDFLLGYFVNRIYVFETDENKSHKKTFALFLTAGLTFRGINWLLYYGMITYLGLYILTAQLIATLAVLVVKYFVYKKIF